MKLTTLQLGRPQRRANAEWGLRIAEYSRSRTPQPPAPSPQPLAPHNRGVTLPEVLISMGILAMGLLGAAAMFPVGSYYMQKGEVADRGAAIAHAAFADLVARGELSPENWQVWDGNTNPMMGTMMRNWMSNNAGLRNGGEAGYQRSMNEGMGFVYVIDPLGTAASAQNADPTRLLMCPFGADPNQTEDYGPSMALVDEDPRWAEFIAAWPVRRLNSSSASVNGVPSEAVASSVYKSGDDLNFVPSEEDGPTQLRMVGDTTGDGVANLPLARESKGDYSWMAMVAPTVSDAREALALDPSAYYFDVSVVVFFKRNVRDLASTERLVAGKVLSTGTGGGELLLTQLQGDTDSSGNLVEKPFEELRPGQWVMVSGPHTASTPNEPLFFTQWYKVLAVDDQPRGSDFTSPTQQRIVGLRGPDWPWGAGAKVRVGLFPGAVAVHTKTMRLESLGAYQR